MIVREETAADIAAIQTIIETAFGQQDEADLVEALRAGGHAEISLVAEDHGAPVGHVMLSRMTEPSDTLGLAPVSVAPDRQRQGIGTALVKAAIGEARARGWGAVFVVGEPDYYRRFGFDPEKVSDFASPFPAPYLMALELIPGTLAAGGELRYAPPFDALS